MRFPSRLLLANIWIATTAWAGFLVAIALIGTGVAIFGEITRSAWELSSQIPRWYSLFAGVALVNAFLPLYIAHGQTRRQFGAQAAVTVTLFAPFLAFLLTVGYLIEAFVYDLAGLPQRLERPHLFTEPTQVPLVFAEYLVEFLAWIVAGALMSAGFYRWDGGGVLMIPVGLGLILLAESAIGAKLGLPFIKPSLGLDLSRSSVMTAGLALGVFLLGLALTWLIIRDIPLRNRAK